MSFLQLGFHFLFGGIIVASVYHFATVVHDPAFAAILGAFPLTILCCYIIHDPVTLKEYAHNMLSVLGLTFGTFIVMIGLIAWTRLHPVVIVSIVLSLWICIQWFRYNYVHHGLL